MMKKHKTLKTLFHKIVVFAIVFISGISINAKDIYVSKSGKDSNNGTKNSPFKTIAKASSIAKAGDVVIIGAGTYEELLEPKNSGSPGNPIIYRAKAGEKVIITAMQAVNNWTVDQGNIYKATVNWDLGQDNMALHNDNLMDLARWPNNTPQNLFERDYLPACNSGAAGGGKTWMNYNGSQSNGHARSIPHANKWKNGGSIHFYGGAGFLAWTDYVTNSSSNRIDFKLNRRQNWIQLRHHPGYTGHGVKKGEFFLQGIKEALDYKNEWFYDKKNKTLYVQIDGGGAPANNSIRFRRRTQTIKLNKNYIHVENLAVFGGSIDITGSNNKLYRVSSFYGNHTLGVIDGFDSRRQSVLMTGNKNTIEQCEIAWGAGNGVYDKGDDNKLLNSYVHDFNYLGNYDCILNTRGAKRGKYRNNTLTRAGKDIIQAYVDGGEFAYNDISFNNAIADDGGLLYTTNVRAAKSSIHHNTFHDSRARKGRFKGAGIYLDNDSKNWDVHHNVVWNTKWTNIQINWNGTNLNIFNNTFAKGSATMGAWHKAGTRFSNVKVWNNITDKEATDQQGNQETESTWEPQSDKQNNLVSRASFKNYNNNDYTLKAGAQAINYGRVIAGFTNGYQGSKPDAGAYEFGVTPFKTGINWNIDNGPTGLGCYGLPGESTNCTNTGGDGCTNPTTWYADADNDSLGDPDQSQESCDQPEGYVDNADDQCPNDPSNTCNDPAPTTNTIPGVVQAEAFSNQQGIQSENTSDTGGGSNVGYINNGDWTEYTVEVLESGNYDVVFRVATNTQGGNIVIKSGQTTLSTVNVVNTGGWQTWKEIKTNFDLSEGSQKLRLEFTGGNGFLFNLNYFEAIKNQTNPTVSQTITLSPIHDAYLQNNTRYNNSVLRIEKNKRIGYLMFDLSSINGTIKKIDFKFTVNSDAGNGNVEIYKGQHTNWTEQNLSNGNKPGKAQTLGTINKNYSIGSTYTVPFNIQNVSNGKLSLIMEALGGNDFAFASKENNNGKKPQLVVTYESARTEGSNQLFQVYPNPFNDMIVFKEDMSGKTVKVYDLTGMLRRDITFKKGENSVHFEGLESGAYVLKIFDDSIKNKTVNTITIIKK